jgi:Uma2 family endonuclease
MAPTTLETSPQTLTLEQFLQLPETKPASEFIDGQILQKPMPQGRHSAIQGELVIAINAALRPAARAYPELRCIFDGRATVPDVTVFRADRIPRDENGEVLNIFSIASDWTIEILSPNQNQSRVVRNILHCLANGSQMGWLIDPDEKMVFVYFADQRTAVFEGEGDRLPVPDFAEGFSLTVGQLFAWLKL